MSTSFAQLGLPRPLVAALEARDINAPFPIQAAAIPDALAGRDVSGKAPTGSGKTLAFGLPMLATIGRAGRNRPRALVLAPTRELAEQIRIELAPLAKAAGRRVAAVFGGVSYGPQKAALRKGADVLVATPGRLEDLLEQRAVELGDAGFVVVDEADRMADMGFMPAVRRILDRTPPTRQTLLFSATLDGDVAELSRRYQRDPVSHDAGNVEPEMGDADHRFWLVDRHERARHTADLVGATGRSIVFTRTRHGADRLARQLAKLDVGAVSLHGGRTQGQRTRALQAFSSGKAQALVATDVAARGIHVDGVDAVIHFDPPRDAKDYVHRSGRTARAGAPGTVVSLVTGDQRNAVRRMQRDLDFDTRIAAPSDDAPVAARRADARPAHRPKGNSNGNGNANGNRNGATRPASGNGNGATRPASGNGNRATRPASGEGDRVSLYVANLPWKTTEDDLEELFARHGTVHQATIITERRTGRSRGFGFVDMPAPAADAAVARLHGSSVAGRDLTVRPAKPSRYHD